MNLRDYLYFEKIKGTEFARTLGVHHNHVYGLVNGTRRPSMALAYLIRNVTGGKVGLADLGLDEKQEVKKIAVKACKKKKDEC